MQNNHINYIEMYSNNLAHTRVFYNFCFGWEFTDYGSNYVAFSHSGLDGGFEYSDAQITNGALVVLYHDNLVTAMTKIKEAGGVITKDIFMFPGGSRFHFLDTTGNELAVWSK